MQIVQMFYLYITSKKKYLDILHTRARDNLGNENRLYEEKKKEEKRKQHRQLEVEQLKRPLDATNNRPYPIRDQTF